MPCPKRNIGVRSGMPTRGGMPTRASAASVNPSPAATGDASLKELFTSLQLSIAGQFRELRRDNEARWQREDRRREEKEAADRRTQAALEARMAEMENRIQVVVSLLQGARGSVDSGANARGGETVADVHNDVHSDVNSDVHNGVNSGVISVPPAHVTAPVVAPAAVSFSEPHVLRLGYAVKPTVFDGKTSWEEYKVQFDTIARANGWDDQEKATALVATLGGAARSVLTTLSAAQCANFAELVSALEFRYGAKNLSNLNFVLFQSHRQRRDESISSFATKIERLAQSAFAECPAETRDKLSASQFVTALSSSVMQRELRLGGFTSLRAAVTRALEIEAVARVSRSPAVESLTTVQRMHLQLLGRSEVVYTSVKTQQFFFYLIFFSRDILTFHKFSIHTNHR